MDISALEILRSDSIVNKICLLLQLSLNIQIQVNVPGLAIMNESFTNVANAKLRRCNPETSGWNFGCVESQHMAGQRQATS